jgi:hypothetical protein
MEIIQWHGCHRSGEKVLGPRDGDQVFTVDERDFFRLVEMGQPLRVDIATRDGQSTALAMFKVQHAERNVGYGCPGIESQIAVEDGSEMVAFERNQVGASFTAARHIGVNSDTIGAAQGLHTQRNLDVAKR